MAEHPSFVILIPTRNRPSHIRKLLNSLLLSSLNPSQIIIVASGEDISGIIKEFETKLPITYVHTLVIGQVNQKKIGLKLVIEKCSWVVFLDDDLVVAANTFETAFSTLNEQMVLQSKPILGVGLNIGSTTRIKKVAWVGRTLGKFFLLDSNSPGAILKSGQAVNYLDEPKSISTQWLNGASMWQKNSVFEYSNHAISSKYAAYEDVRFSYSQSKKGQLIYSPNSVVKFQDNILTDYEAKSVYESAAYIRMSFTLDNPELSPILCTWSQIGRSIFAVKQKGFSDFNYLFFLSQINLRLFLVSIKLKRIQTLLDKISSKE